MQEIQQTKKLLKSFQTYLINGVHVPRIKFMPKQKQPGRCEECEVTRGAFHRLHCSKEKAVCSNKEHKRMIDCDCPVQPGEQI